MPGARRAGSAAHALPPLQAASRAHRLREGPSRGKIPHDFRRTEVRNLARIGVDRKTAMEMVGHKTESIYRRYTISDEAMLRDASARLAALREA